MIIELKDAVTRIPDELVEWALELSADGKQLTYTYDPRNPHTGIASLLSEISDAGLLLKDIQTSQSSLEEIFVNLVKKKT